MIQLLVFCFPGSAEALVRWGRKKVPFDCLLS